MCGSTQFLDTFQLANRRETLAGRIVLSIGIDFKSGDAATMPEDVKARLDELHLRKIDLADEVLFLNVGGYMGESTRKELAYAEKNHKIIRFWEPQ